jgi:Mrp family chromosome partitioning ATPase
LSLIENSLDKLRRTGASPKEPLATPVALPTVAELRHTHRRTAVDFARLRAAGYLPEQGQERRFADYCHRIKRPLIDRALAPGAPQDTRLILLSSALPGDGKTFITMNLALSMARERDISVLLVDGDLPKAQITQVLGLRGEPGLLEALKDDRLDVESLVLDTDVPNLEILPAGAPTDGAAELVASARMRDVTSRLIGRNPRRLVLFDSPPLLVSSEARALMPIPGQTVLVARAGHTPQRALTDAIGLVDKKKLQGLVVNDAHVSAGDHDYYYDYGVPIAAEGAKRD